MVLVLVVGSTFPKAHFFCIPLLLEHQLTLSLPKHT